MKTCSRPKRRRAARRGADAERLGRVVPGRDHVEAELAGGGHDALRRLAGQQRLRPGGRGLLGEVRAGARDDRQALHARRSASRGQRLARCDLPDAVEQLAGLDAVVAVGSSAARKPIVWPR